MAANQTTITKGSASFKLIVPLKMEKKIRRLLNRIYNIEWSGILFYKFTGTFMAGDFTVICEDVLPLNIGNSVYTEFDFSPEVLSYMVQNDLMDCKTGLIHSHHNMPTFFSGTDTATLASEGSDMNNFVSLIVNNDGTYSAAVTHKEHQVINRSIKLTSPFYDIDTIEKEFTDKVVEDKLFYNMLEVTVEKEDESDFQDLDERIEELKKANKQKLVKDVPSWVTEKAPKDSQLKLDLEEDPFKCAIPLERAKDTKDDDDFVEEFSVPDDILEATLAQLVTGNITAKKIPNEETLKAFDKRFKERCLDHEELDYIIDTLVSTVIETMVNHYSPNVDPGLKMAFLAEACCSSLLGIGEYMPTVQPMLMKQLECYVQ